MTTDQYACEVLRGGKVVMRSKNLRAVHRYTAVSPVLTVRAIRCPANPYNGKLYVYYVDGAQVVAHFASYTIMLEWLAVRRWPLAKWEIELQPMPVDLDSRLMAAIRALAKKGRF